MTATSDDLDDLHLGRLVLDIDEDQDLVMVGYWREWRRDVFVIVTQVVDARNVAN